MTSSFAHVLRATTVFAATSLLALYVLGPASAAPTRPDANSGSASPAQRVLAHSLRSMPRARDAAHRFRVPLAEVEFSFVDLHYETPLVDALADHALLVNGGYWAYSGRKRVIQGLLVVNDVSFARRAASSGAVLEVHGGKARMVRTGDYSERAGTSFALQCSPRLVDDARVIPKLDTVHHAARTALCIGADPALLDVYLTAEGVRPTLHEFAEFLAADGCRQALNLDGGPSTAAVARGETEGVSVGRGFALPYGIGVRFRP